ncbi:hypothetical protein NC652_008312 [Populus alba x Populus x berolinensis]|nr:hypothetical protein NC652_008312 [Populus alba x Populus x berolinensis]
MAGHLEGIQTGKSQGSQESWQYREEAGQDESSIFSNQTARKKDSNRHHGQRERKTTDSLSSRDLAKLCTRECSSSPREQGKIKMQQNRSPAQ